ncbi:MAG: QueT transporter family protein [Clostridia bacterium]|nr:QueT transporter family protein [Clostridia bacterium]
MKYNMNLNSFRRLTFCAVVAASYAALTVSGWGIAYGPLQFRLSEALCVLPYFAPWTSWGLLVGCSVANIFSNAGTMGLDIIVGATATFAAGFLTSRIKNKYIALLPPVVVNGLTVGAMLMLVSGELSWKSFALCSAGVATGELVVMYLLGLPLLILTERSGIDRMLRSL